VYSFAVVIWEVTTRRVPWNTPDTPITLSSIIESVVNGGRLKTTEAEKRAAMKEARGLMELMESCWKQDPVERPTFTDILTSIDAIRENMVAVPRTDRRAMMKQKSAATHGNSINIQNAITGT